MIPPSLIPIAIGTADKQRMLNVEPFIIQNSLFLVLYSLEVSKF